MDAQAMIRTHPDVAGSVNDVLVRCIEECLSCAQACIVCADACIAEQQVQSLRQCIRLDLDCADVCDATAKLASRRTGSNPELLRRMIDTCAEACRLCGEECARHAEEHEHCRICADACRSCEEACRRALPSVH